MFFGIVFILYMQIYRRFCCTFCALSITIIDDIIWKTELLKKIKNRLLPRRKKKSLDSLLYDCSNANDKLNSLRFERSHLHNHDYYKLLNILVTLFFLSEVTVTDVSSKRKIEESPGGREPDMKMTKVENLGDLIVLGLPWKTTDADLEQYFSQYGELDMSEASIPD